MWKEVHLLSTNFSAKHTPSATLTKGLECLSEHAIYLVYLVKLGEWLYMGINRYKAVYGQYTCEDHCMVVQYLDKRCFWS